MPNPQVNSQVPEVIVNANGDTELTVQVAGLMQDKTVEIYGYVTQNDGKNVRYASFREPSVVLKPNGNGVAEYTVTVTRNQVTLMPDKPVTVVTWVSEVWPSMLHRGPSVRTPGAKTSWTIINAPALNYPGSAQAVGGEPADGSSPA